MYFFFWFGLPQSSVLFLSSKTVLKMNIDRNRSESVITRRTCHEYHDSHISFSFVKSRSVRNIWTIEKNRKHCKKKTGMERIHRLERWPLIIEEIKIVYRQYFGIVFNILPVISRLIIYRYKNLVRLYLNFNWRNYNNLICFYFGVLSFCIKLIGNIIHAPINFECALRKKIVFIICFIVCRIDALCIRSLIAKLPWKHKNY